jgi:hypothetical protein
VNVRDYDGETREVTRFGATQASAERRLKQALRDRTGPAADGEITADTTGFPGASQLDRSRMPVWIEQLRDAEAGIRQLRLALQAMVDEVERVCIVCGTPIVGRADKVLCSATCRKRFNRGAPTPYAGPTPKTPMGSDS